MYNMIVLHSHGVSATQCLQLFVTDTMLTAMHEELMKSEASQQCVVLTEGG